MDLSSSTMIPFLAHSNINTSHPMCFSFTIQVCVLSVIFFESLGSFCCGKSDCHRLCCEFVHSRLPRLLSFQACLELFWSFPRASVSGDSSSRSQALFFGVLSCHAKFLSVSKFPGSLQVSQHLATTLELSVALPYYDEPTISFYHNIDLLLHRTFS
jgi:hypothetical protein